MSRRGAAPSCNCGTCRVCRKREGVRLHYERNGIKPQTEVQRLRGNERRRIARQSPEAKAKRKAHNAVAAAVAKGTLVRGACERLGPDCKGRIEAHHDDYGKPLEVRWLCVRHHSAVDREP